MCPQLKYQTQPNLDLKWRKPELYFKCYKIFSNLNINIKKYKKKIYKKDLFQILFFINLNLYLLMKLFVIK